MRVGVYTLPLLYALEADASVEALLGTPTPDVDAIRDAVVRTGAFERSLAVAADHVDKALAALERTPPGPARDSLERLSHLVIERVPVLE